MTYVARIALFFAFLPALALARDAADLIARGDQLDRQFQTDESLVAYLQADQLDPADPQILYRIALAYGLQMEEAGNPQKAREAGLRALDFARRAVRADPQYAKAHLALAVSYGRLAEISDNKTKLTYARLIKEHADLALSLDPRDDLVCYLLGSWSQGIAGLNPVLRRLAGLIYGDLPAATNEEALAYFQKAVALNPHSIRNQLGLAEILVVLRRSEDARPHFRAILLLPATERGDEKARAKARAALPKL